MLNSRHERRDRIRQVAATPWKANAFVAIITGCDRKHSRPERCPLAGYVRLWHFGDYIQTPIGSRFYQGSNVSTMPRSPTTQLSPAIRGLVL